jgi:hypothetical protein
MIEAPVGIEADRRQGDGQRSRQQRVSEREKRVHRVGRGAAVAPGEVEPERRRLRRENAPEVAEVNRAGLAFNAEEFGGLTRMRCALGEATELGESG